MTEVKLGATVKGSCVLTRTSSVRRIFGRLSGRRAPPEASASLSLTDTRRRPYSDSAKDALPAKTATERIVVDPTAIE